MQIVIDIPEEIYNSACATNNIWDMRMAGFVCSAIANGTPLEEELHREKEQAYYCGYEDGRKSEWTAVAESEDKE